MSFTNRPQGSAVTAKQRSPGNSVYYITKCSLSCCVSVRISGTHRHSVGGVQIFLMLEQVVTIVLYMVRLYTHPTNANSSHRWPNFICRLVFRRFLIRYLTSSRGFPSVSAGKWWDSTSIKLRLFPSKSFHTHYSSVFLPSGVVSVQGAHSCSTSVETESVSLCRASILSSCLPAALHFKGFTND
jgi:hypothetical protein